MLHFLLVAWLLRRLRACFLSKIPFLIVKCTHLVVSAQISLQEKHLTQVYGKKQSQLLSTTSPLWFWRRIRHVIHFRDKFLSFLLWNIMFWQWLSITMSTRTRFIFQLMLPHLFRYIDWPEGLETVAVHVWKKRTTTHLGQFRESTA